jgi:hypothetical protein
MRLASAHEIAGHSVPDSLHCFQVEAVSRIDERASLSAASIAIKMPSGKI